MGWIFRNFWCMVDIFMEMYKMRYYLDILISITVISTMVRCLTKKQNYMPTAFAGARIAYCKSLGNSLFLRDFHK